MDASLHAFINAGIEALWPVGDRYGEATGVPYLTYKVVITILHGQFVIRKPAACFQAHNVDSRLDSTSTVIEILSLSASQACNPHIWSEKSGPRNLPGAFLWSSVGMDDSLLETKIKEHH